jgi:hypothetical protein
LSAFLKQAPFKELQLTLCRLERSQKKTGKTPFFVKRCLEGITLKSRPNWGHRRSAPHFSGGQRSLVGDGAFLSKNKDAKRELQNLK